MVTNREDAIANLRMRPVPVRTLVAIPCFNEELAIGSLVLRSREHADDVLVIDDGSKDRTVEIARAAGAQVIVHEKNSGKGRAIQNAFRYAKEKGYDVLVLMDGDGQHDPDEIPLLIEPILRNQSGGVDISLGFRFGDRTEMPMWRKVGKRVLDYATAAGGARTVTDSQCGYRAFGRRAIDVLSVRLATDGFGVESEQLVHAKAEGLSMENVPITCKYDGLDGSTKGPVAHAMGVLGTLVELVTARHPLLFVGLPSAALLLVATGLGIYTLQSYNVSHVFSIPFALTTATLALLGTFGCFTALILNLVGEMERKFQAARR